MTKLLNKLAKTNDGLAEEVQAQIDKAAEKALKDRNKEIKSAIATAKANVKAAGYDKDTRNAAILALEGVAEELI